MFGRKSKGQMPESPCCHYIDDPSLDGERKCGVPALKQGFLPGGSGICRISSEQTQGKL